VNGYKRDRDGTAEQMRLVPRLILKSSLSVCANYHTESQTTHWTRKVLQIRPVSFSSIRFSLVNPPQVSASQGASGQPVA
jgi:hypothetical protein